MKATLRIAAVVVGAACVSAAAQEPGLKELFDKHRWFELRDAIADKGKSVPALYAGAVASAFNDVTRAESLLKRAIKEAKSPAAANEARDILLNLYMRQGRSMDMLRLIDDAAAAEPGRNDIANARTAFEALRRAPDMRADPGTRMPFQCEASDEGIVLPGTVNGKEVNWLFDSAFSHVSMAESEADRLGVPVMGANASAGDYNGGASPVRSGLADRIEIGGAVLRNVPVLVFPDARPPWNDMPMGRRGAIGLPAVLAVGGMRIMKGQFCQLDPNPKRAPGGASNLAFDGMTPIARATYAGEPLDVVIDTGNQGGTQLWNRFSMDFPDLIAGGTKGTKKVTQIGGSTDREIVILPELQLMIGGFAGVLKPANVFASPVGDANMHANIGLDVLMEAHEIVFDFRTMTLTLR